jgi:hypothetical protein
MLKIFGIKNFNKNKIWKNNKKKINRLIKKCNCKKEWNTDKS